MRRWAPQAMALLTVGVAAFAAVADGALRERAQRREEARALADSEASRRAADALRGAIARLEEDVAEGTPRVDVERRALPAAPMPRAGADESFRDLPRSELIGRLTSTRATPRGLPEAVVAALALGEPALLSRAADRLLEGELPVEATDLGPLVRMLGAGDDPRLERLESQLARAPRASTLPALPRFRRSLEGGPGGTLLVGWTRGDAWRRIGYEIPLSALEDLAGDGVTLSADGAAPPAHAAPGPVPGLSVAVASSSASWWQRHGERALLWGAALLLVATALLAARALAREGRALERERSFLAAVTHELRSPLASMRLLGQTLEAGRGEPRDYGRLVARESERLETLVEQVLAAARTTESPCFADASVDDVLAEAAEIVAPRARDRAVRIERPTGTPSVGTVRWDADAVRRAVVNLLDNAIRHGPAPGTVTLTATSDGGDVVVAVHDEGSGPRRKDRRRIFGRFERGSRGSEGTGLGLWIVDSVARAHGGHVALDVARPRGTGGSDGGCTFSLRLPRDAEAVRSATLRPDRDDNPATATEPTEAPS